MRRPTERMLTVTKRWAEGYSDEEVAKEFGITARTVKATRNVCRQHMGVEVTRKLAHDRRFLLEQIRKLEAS